MRLEYLMARLESDTPILSEHLRDPARENPVRFARLTGDRAGIGGGPRRGSVLGAHSRHGIDRFRSLETEVIGAVEGGSEGPVYYCGADGLAIYVRAILDTLGQCERELFVIDQFRAVADGSSAGDTTASVPVEELRRDLNTFRDVFARYGLLSSAVVFVQGDADSAFAEPFSGAPSIVVVDSVSYPGALKALRVVSGWGAPGARFIVLGRDDVPAPLAGFAETASAGRELRRPDRGSLAWTVSLEESDRGPAERADADVASPLARPPVVSAVSDIDLSIVVCFYNMRREAARTLMSLSRAYQIGTDDIDYEVIVVENGSSDEHKLGESYVTSFGQEFRYVDIGAGAHPSPTTALNEGIRLSRGRSVGVMIDGAHVVTPGVVALSQQALASYRDAVVVVQQWYVGPGQQGSATMAGYDQEAEDELFRRIQWPADGYRLFEVSHPISDRDWFDKVGESNCLIVPRALLRQAGGVDDSFNLPGGEYSNLEFFERMTSAPGYRVVKLLGEASFHQVHGGTTTNTADSVALAEQLAGYHAHFREIRGRAFRGSRKDLHFIGSIRPSALRTRPRRFVAPVFRDRVDVVEGEKPDVGAPVPDELRTEFIAAYYDSLVWEQMNWLGSPLDICVTDLMAYQMILAETRPDVVLSVGSATTGRNHFVATVLDELDHGRVVHVAPGPASLPHDRVQIIDGNPFDPEIVEQIRNEIADAPAMLIVGLGDQRHVTASLETYSPHVPVGGYAVVEHTIVNGHPVRVGFGTGPREAVDMFVHRHREFGIDTRVGNLVLTFNSNGYLRRFTG